MGDQQRKKQKRRGSILKAINQKNEAKLWQEEADSHLKTGNLLQSLQSFDKALELNPIEKNSLVARSKCYILLGQPGNALKDAEAALHVDKTFIKAIYQKAEALYYLGDFEHSLMYYHRGLHLRPDHQGFKLGVQKSQKAIENAIGSISDIKTTGQPSARSASSRNTVKKPSRLLRELAADKDYLDGLMQNPDIKCKFKETDTKIENCIKETVDYLNARQEFWRQQLPKHLK